MNITKDNKGDLLATIKIELKEADYQEKVKEVLKDYQRKANIPGFRQGKVPFGMINKMYGKAVVAEEINKMVSDSLNQYITDEKIELLGYPLPNLDETKQIDFDTQNDFDFYFDIAMTPEFDIELSEKIKINYYNIKADEAVVDKYLADLRTRNGKSENPEVGEETDTFKGDFIQLDKDGNEIADGIATTTTVSLDLFKLKTEKKKFTSKKVGDTVIFNPMRATKSAIDVSTMLNISLEEAEKLKNDFSFTISEITRTELAEVNEEFFKLVYPQEEIKDEKELLERIKKDAEVNFERESDRQFMNNAVEELIKIADVDLPEEFLKRWLLESNEGKVTAEQIASQYDSYVKSLTWQLIENKIVTAHKLEVKEDDVRNTIKGYFTNLKAENADEEADSKMNEIVDSIMQNKEETKRIYDQLYDQKLSDLFKSKLKKTNKAVSYEEFVKLATQNN